MRDDLFDWHQLQVDTFDDAGWQTELVRIVSNHDDGSEYETWVMLAVLEDVAVMIQVAFNPEPDSFSYQLIFGQYVEDRGLDLLKDLSSYDEANLRSTADRPGEG